jgi:glutathione peroxidase
MRDGCGIILSMSGFYDVQVRSIDGSPDLLGALRGKVALAVNVASRCGYTPQYAGLERLHGELAGEGFSVIGFPCNQFGGQEPGTDPEIASFCQVRYGVTFPLSAKLEVNGPGRHPLYAWLTGQGFEGDIEWNFEKFLIGRDGRVLRRYPSATTPQDSGLMQDIADAL